MAINLLMMSSTHKHIPVGTIVGSVPIHPSIAQGASAMAVAFFAEQEAIEFCGDAVQSFAMPRWLGNVETLIPREQLHALGLQADLLRLDCLATVGVDMHVDGLNGLTLCLVLYNDGLQFQQGNKRCRPVAGEWFLFDDAKSHGVHDKAATTTWLCITAPVAHV